MEDFFFKVFFGVMACVAVVFGFVVFDAIFSEKITLRKSDWHCTQQHNERRMMMAGKVPVMTTQTICDRYERIR